MDRLDRIAAEIRKATSEVPYGQKRFNIQYAVMMRVGNSQLAKPQHDWRANHTSYRNTM